MSPIRGLTDRGAALPNVGFLRKGSEKRAGGFGADLPHFRFSSDDAAVVEHFGRVFGPEPNELRVILAAETKDEAFEAWCEEFAAGGLKHRCDGERVVIQLSADGKHYERFAAGCGPACPGGCKPRGRLKVIVVGAGLRGTVTAMTSSRHDLLTISSTLAFVERVNGTVLGVPFLLRRVKRNISTPRDGTASGRARQDKWLIDLQPDPEWLDGASALTTAQRLELRAPPMPALPPPTDDDGDEDEDDWPASPSAPTNGEARERPSDVLGHRDGPTPGATGKNDVVSRAKTQPYGTGMAPAPHEAGQELLTAAHALVTEARELNSRFGLMLGLPDVDPADTDEEIVSALRRINAAVVEALEAAWRGLHADRPEVRPPAPRPPEGASSAVWRDYRHALAEAIAAARNPKAAAAAAPTPAPRQTATPAPPHAAPADADPPSPAQVRYIFAVAKEHGLSPNDVKNECMARHAAKDPGQLTKQQASRLISDLKEGKLTPPAPPADPRAPRLLD